MHTHHSGHHHAVPAHAGHAGGALRWALTLTLGFAFVEVVVGWYAGSLALLGDAGHMFSDSMALGVAAVAAWFMRRPPSARHSYGLVRAEVLAALLNGLLMIAVVTAIAVEAVSRFRDPHPVSGGVVMAAAFIGLVINVAVALVLSRGEKNLNVRAALLHVMGDLLASVSALIAGAVVYVTGWMLIDPILSLVICALILYSTLRLLREAMHVLMEGVPAGVDLNDVGRRLAQVKGVQSVHDLHIWTLSSGYPALSAHVVLRDMAVWMDVLGRMRALLMQNYGIDHVTLQPESSTGNDEVFPLKPKKRRK